MTSAAQHPLAAVLGVIERFDIAVAEEFSRTTEALLRSWSGPGVLNRNGAPVEFSFGSTRNELRYTVEIAGPPVHRLAAIGGFLRGRGVSLSHVDFSGLIEVQTDCELQFGAWLGVRHRRGAPPAYKIYAETNEAADGHPVLVGVDLQSARRELYFEHTDGSLTKEKLFHLLSRAGLEHRLHELTGAIASFDFLRPSQAGELPGAQYGFSYSTLPDGLDPVFSLFVFAADLAGGDGYIRRQVLACAARSGWDPACYAALTEPLAECYLRSGHHNMISFSTAPNGVRFQVSVAPPSENPGRD